MQFLPVVKFNNYQGFFIFLNHELLIEPTCMHFLNVIVT